MFEALFNDNERRSERRNYAHASRFTGQVTGAATDRVNLLAGDGYSRRNACGVSDLWLEASSFS